MTETDPYAPLHGILRRLDTLLERRGLTREDVVDPDELSAATGLATTEIRTLLRGGRPRERTLGEFVPRRVNFLYKRLLAASGRRPADIVGEVAAALNATSVWARSLLQGDKLPNVPHLTALAEYFRVPVTFFTDSAPVALARELRPIVSRLEEPDPLATLMERFGIQRVHARTDGPITPSQKAAIAAFLEVVLSREGSQR
ncbi:MAG TPA: transcriptional regulator [Streptomyces sp.]|uniref:transcriptional regulator n=1 Tax=Streptomyces sp. TaxID=1931 RepID=UPI002D699604|nr:transcriptional regulator [Streptomyces sp.]HZG07269.1 transcriptional regulator [Streptomyces sp.]